MARVEDCPFCNIKDRVLKQNAHANLLLSNPRKVEGHFLVTPKRHIEVPWDLKPEELQSVFELIFFTQKLLAEHYGGGSDVKQHCRPFMKQDRFKVDHVHFHILPRTWQDELYKVVEKYETALFIDLPLEEQERMSKLVRDQE